MNIISYLQLERNYFYVKYIVNFEELILKSDVEKVKFLLA